MKLKCKIIFSSRTTKFHVNYYIGDQEFETVNSIQDLGISLEQWLDFRRHMCKVLNKAYIALGFMERWCKEFSNIAITKNFYTSLVRSLLEYGSVIWYPIYSVYCERIESVLKQFLFFISVKEAGSILTYHLVNQNLIMLN